MLFIAFIRNLLIGIAFVFLLFLISDKFKSAGKSKLFKKILPISAGILSLTFMLERFPYQDNVWDLRHVPIFFISYTMGWKAGLISIFIPSLYRLHIGGTAWKAIFLSLVFPLMIASLFHKLHNKQIFKKAYYKIDLKKLLIVSLIAELIRSILVKYVLNLSLGMWLKVSTGMLVFSTLTLISITLIINRKKRNDHIENELKRNKENYKNLIEIAPIPMIIHCNNKIIFANNSAIDTLNIKSLNTVKGESINNFISYNDISNVEQRMQALAEGEELEYRDIKLENDEGDLFDAEVIAIQIEYNGKSAILSVFKDITEKKKKIKKYEHMAYHDKLTGLPNRNKLSDGYQRLINSSQKVGILFIDLDHFKNVNDKYGHDVGDQLLIEIAERLKNGVRSNDIVVRHGGDEFIVITAVENNQDVTILTNRLLTKINQPFQIGQEEIQISASIGISVYPDDNKNLDELIKDADKAMYKAKNQGKNQLSFAK